MFHLQNDNISKPYYLLISGDSRIDCTMFGCEDMSSCDQRSSTMMVSIVSDISYKPVSAYGGIPACKMHIKS